MKKIFLMSAAAAGLFGFAAMTTEASAGTCDSFRACWYQNLNGSPTSRPITGRSAAHSHGWQHGYRHHIYDGERQF